MPTNMIETAAYRDVRLPIKQRVEDLLGRMTLAEKIAQLGSLWVYEIAGEQGLNRAWRRRAWRTAWAK